jgi:hypothetical protein
MAWVGRSDKAERVDVRAIKELRQQHSKPILDEIGTRLTDWSIELLPKSPIGRKNWLFAGRDAGAERAAVIYSLVASCKLCRIDPFAYLRDVLDRVSTHPASRIADLTPSRWAKTSPHF